MTIKTDDLKIEKPVALADWTYEYLRDKLLNLEIEPGEQLRIEDFTELLNVSRTPIREAFLRLSSEGLIKVVPRVGYFATEMTEEDICEVCEVREIIESRAVRRAAETLSDDDLVVLGQIMDQTRKAVREKDLDAFMQNEISFHEFLHKNYQNKRLIDFMDSLDNVIYRGRVLANNEFSILEQTLKEHEAIYNAIVNRNADKAAWFMGEHLQNVSDRLVELLTRRKKDEEEGTDE
jgi:DNA-binding GntR family transcriptional regulator